MTFFPPPRPRSGAVDPRAAFAADAERAVREALPTASVTYAPESFALLIENDKGRHTYHLENTFLETREMPADARRDRIVAFARGALAHRVPARWEDVRARLVPVLRPASTFSTLRAEARALSTTFVRRPVLPFLSACLVLDDERTMQYVDSDVVAGWGVSEKEAFEAACGNLARADAHVGVAPYDRDAAYPIWHVATSDSYDSSRLLLPGWLASFAGRVHGRPIAIVPERGQIIVAGDGEDRALDRLLATAERELVASPRGISPAVYGVGEDGRVVPYVAPVGHPLRERTRIAHYKLAILEYRRQKEALDEDHARAGVDVFVGSYFAAVSESNGEATSWVAWPRNDASLLAVADYVALQHPKRDEPLWVRWSQVREIAGAHLRDEPGLDPARVRTSGYPDARMLADLEKVAGW